MVGFATKLPHVIWDSFPVFPFSHCIEFHEFTKCVQYHLIIWPILSASSNLDQNFCRTWSPLYKFHLEWISHTPCYGNRPSYHKTKPIKWYVWPGHPAFKETLESLQGVCEVNKFTQHHMIDRSASSCETNPRTMKFVKDRSSCSPIKIEGK